ncbi:MAG: DUF4097 family beta strand repeat-containing protein [Roseburia sp.]|nr:DUF4097 family beta strand repeat-containing protein [Roseburia sp.]MCM1099695.1 DUF4097 family beta strand repeat-containing protein [Ruminococcus flavefaciens]
MKGFMKGCAVLAAVLLIAGLVLGVVASTVRGRTAIEEVVEKATGGRVRLNLGNEDGWGLLVEDDWFGDSDGVNYEIDDRLDFDSSREVQKGDVEKSRLEGTVENLEVKVGGCAFLVKESGDDSFYVETRNTKKFQAYIESGTLYITSTTGSVNHWSEIRDVSVTLYVPTDFRYQKAELEMGAGSLSYPGLQADSASVEVGAGKIELENAQVKELEIEVGAGQAEVTGMQVEELKVEVGMGEFRGDGAIDGDVNIECSMGNLELCVAGRQEDFNYEIDGALGNISLGGAFDGREFGGLSKERSVNNGASKEMEISCAMGNITISFQE